MALKKINKNDLCQRDLSNLTPVNTPANIQLLERHECKRCSSQFQDDSELNAHVCPTEMEIASNENSKIKKRARDQQNGMKVFQCNLCQLILKSVKLIWIHRKRFHKNDLRCHSRNCATFFFTEADRKKHELSVHGKWINCIYCGAYFSKRVRWMQNHIKKSHKEAIQCDFSNRCREYFHTQTEKDEHVLKVHTPKPVNTKECLEKGMCIYCNKISKNKPSSQLHMVRYHAAVSIKCKFNHCGLYFLSQIECDEHFQKEHKEKDSLKQLQCPKCTYKTASYSSLQAHVKNIHCGGTVKCPTCPKKFHSQKILNTHLRASHGERGTCEHCGKEMLKYSLLRHFQRTLCHLA